MTNLPGGYDAWRTDPGPAYDGPTPEQEREMEQQEAHDATTAAIVNQAQAAIADILGSLSQNLAAIGRSIDLVEIGGPVGGLLHHHECWITVGKDE